MPTYTVHAPPPQLGAGDPEGFVFVRDGFYFWAFLAAALWFLFHRLWLVLLLYLVFSGLLGVVFTVLHVPSAVQVVSGLLIALLVGFEAPTLWRWTLQRRGWQMLGFAVGDDQEAAEHRFFAEWTKWVSAVPFSPPAEPMAPPSMPLLPGAPSGPDVIGLFPEPRPER
jgi:hypothetical protein